MVQRLYHHPGVAELRPDGGDVELLAGLVVDDEDEVVADVHLLVVAALVHSGHHRGHVKQNLRCGRVRESVVRGCTCITTWNRTCGVEEYGMVWLGDVLPRGTEPVLWRSMGECG